MRRTLALLVFVVGLSVLSIAQEVEPEITVWGGGSVANGHVFGFDKDRTLILAGTSVSYPLWRSRFPIFYRADLVPLAVLIEPTVTLATGHNGSNQTFSTYGAGASPVGMQMNFPRWKGLQPFAESTGGFLYFSHPVLNPLASQFNFTIAAGMGVQWYFKPQVALTFGFKYHHMSNANITDHNPGVDTSILYIGTTFRRKRLF